MCGIVGVLGKNEVAPLLVEALRRLEYRGYDSAGIATIHNHKIERRRAVGKLANLSDLLVHEPLAGKSGIGHTRWATHGVVNVANAHPHQSKKVAIVHNGIIENFRELRAELAQAGYIQESETDTETIVLLVQQALDQGATPKDALQAVLARLKGAFALCILFEGYEDLLICARRGSPMAIGYGNGEMFVGSDAIALASMTDQISYLEEGDWAVLTRQNADIFDAAGDLVNRPINTIQVDMSRFEKAGHKHFMAKEIAEQPIVIADTIRAYSKITPDDVTFLLPDKLDFANVQRIILIACGTAHYACHVAKYWFEQVAKIPTEIDIASEFRYRKPIISQGTLAIFVSQSGETADTLAALRHIKTTGAKTAAVVNVTTSSIAREADIVLPIHAGIEVGVASTKAFTCQLVTLAILTLKAASQRKAINKAELFEYTTALSSLPGLMNESMQLANTLKDISIELAEAQDILFIGRGMMYPMALEGALKLKEISYIHAEAYAAGELKHGPISLVDGHVPVITLAPSDALFDKTVSNMQEVMARGGKIVLISDTQGIDMGEEGCWKTVTMPGIHPFISPVLYALPIQLLAYYTAVAKGTDVDQPRNLAKSVTVE